MMQLNRILRLLAVAIVIAGGALIYDIGERSAVGGSWGGGSFDNDDAVDFLVRLQSHGADAVRDAFEEVAGPGAQDYLQVDSASSAIAAAEIVAAAHDGDSSQLPETGQEWLDEHGESVVSPSMRVLARRAVERVLLRSELKELWREGGADAQSAAWENGVRHLIKRLEATVAQVHRPNATKKPRVQKMAFEPGAVLRVDLDDQWHIYARMLAKSSWIAFYDRRVTTAEDPLEIVRRPVLFVLYVSDIAYDRGHWPKIGHVPLEIAPSPIPKQFMQSIGPRGSQGCEIIDEFWNVKPAALQECIGLERVAVWRPEHVEERLRDHYAGRPNASVELMKVRLGGAADPARGRGP